jgi:hypothetical protein
LLSPSDSLDVTHVKLPSNSTEDWSSIASRIAVASIGSQGTVGGLLVAGFVSYIHRKEQVENVQGSNRNMSFIQ